MYETTTKINICILHIYKHRAILIYFPFTANIYNSCVVILMIWLSLIFEYFIYVLDKLNLQ